MRELSLHIMDIAENGIRAEADLIKITIDEDLKENLLTIEIEDNGKGIPEELIVKITDPFITTKSERRVGMGLSLLKEAAKRCCGNFNIISSKSGTIVTASFEHDHIDRSPIGDMGSTITALLSGNPRIDLEYKHILNKKDFIFDTKDIKEILGVDSHTNPIVMAKLKNLINDAVLELKKEGGN